MQLAQPLHHASLAAHGHHLQDGGLRAVVTVLGAALALRYPDVFLFLTDGKVHVVGHALAGPEHLAGVQRALHDKRLVHPHQVFHPRQREQVVADGYLAGGGETAVDEQAVEQGRVEHNVAVIAHKGVAAVHIDGAHVHVAPRTGLLQQAAQEVVGKGFLKLEIGFAGPHLLRQRLKGHVGIEIGHYLAELCVGKEAVVDFGQLFGLEGAYAVKFGGYIHNHVFYSFGG